MPLFTVAFAKYAGERALKTVAQTLASLIGLSGLGILDVDWSKDLSIAALAGLLSVLTSVVAKTGGSDSDSDEPAAPDAS